MDNWRVCADNRHARMCGSSCGCAHHKAGPLLIALVGLLFLLKALGVVGAATVDLAWPVALILIGLMKSGMCKCCRP